MGQKTIRVSDITGDSADLAEFGTLTVDQHPQYTRGLPVTLDVFPDEIKTLLADDVALVTGTYTDPDGETARFAVPLAAFDQLREGGMNPPMMEGLANQARQQRRAHAPKATSEKQKARPVNYATLEHAGTPHRGRITDLEKRIVRENLDAVNERLRTQGLREISADDPQTADRYDLNS